VRVPGGVVLWGKVKSYKAPPGTHVVLDAPAATVSATAKRDGDQCEVELAPGGSLPARPLVIAVDAQCNVTADPEATAGSAPVSVPKPAAAPHSPRAGCCGAQTTPASPIATSGVVLALILRRRSTSRARARSSR